MCLHYILFFDSFTIKIVYLKDDLKITIFLLARGFSTLEIQI